jgi:hypothetical protein
MFSALCRVKGKTVTIFLSFAQTGTAAIAKISKQNIYLNIFFIFFSPWGKLVINRLGAFLAFKKLIIQG